MASYARRVSMKISIDKCDALDVFVAKKINKKKNMKDANDTLFIIKHLICCNCMITMKRIKKMDKYPWNFSLSLIKITF